MVGAASRNTLHLVIRSIIVRSFLSLALACSCPQPGPVGDYDAIPLEFIHAQITSLATDAQGDSWVSFGPMARAFAILKQDQQLLAFAKAARANGQTVHVTVRAGHPQKSPASVQQPMDPRRIAVLRLAADPDPRAQRRPLHAVASQPSTR